MASYNVENLFDLHYDKSEYKEYIPNNRSQWNKKAYTIKLNNTIKVLQDLNANVIALQEIESQRVLKDLVKQLPKYKYHAFSKNKNSAVGLAILSQYPIIKQETIRFKTKVNRPIQKVTLDIQGAQMTIFNNHWASKRSRESQRVNFALVLQKAIKKLPSMSDYILLGDFNSNYNEYQTLQFEKRLNDTQGFTGINHVLNTLINDTIVTKENIAQQSVISHYNLWYELPTQKRYSSKFRNKPNTPDNILISKSLFDSMGIAYVNNSFKVFKPNYLYSNGKLNRWRVSKNKIHQQRGFSDHLPIVATFTLQAYKKEVMKKPSFIQDLYAIEQLEKPMQLKKATVIYKHANHALIKAKNDRAIFLYNCAQKLKLGFTYDLQINELKTFQGLKEITNISDIQELNYKANYKELLLTPKNIELNDIRYQNEVITQLTGTYKKGYLYLNNGQKIRLYSKDKALLPKHGENITIISGHMGYFKNQAQIVIYKNSDIKVNF